FGGFGGGRDRDGGGRSFGRDAAPGAGRGDFAPRGSAGGERGGYDAGRGFGAFGRSDKNTFEPRRGERQAEFAGAGRGGYGEPRNAAGGQDRRNGPPARGHGGQGFGGKPSFGGGSRPEGGRRQPR
ncbi:MAG: ATP-dependent helicase, partial [Macromonas sp.]